MLFDYQGRISMVQTRMRQKQVSLLLISPSSDLKYLTGYSYPADDKMMILAILPDSEPVLFASHLHDISQETMPIRDIVYYTYGQELADLLEEQLKKREISFGTVAIEDQMPSAFLLRLMDRLDYVRFVSANELIAPMREVKDTVEQDAVRTACKRAQEALKRCMSLGNNWLGKTEEQLEARMIYEMGRLGLKNNAVSVCFGANAAIPHHHPDQTLIEQGGALLIDFGATYEQYHTDMTRMFFFGEPDDEYRHMYQIVLTALEKGVEACQCGNTLQEVDRVTRAHIADCGYGSYYIHRTSHGVGIDCHDYPKIPVDGRTEITDGMVFSVEPGIYLPGHMGIRIEEQIVMVGGKREILHSFNRNLIQFPGGSDERP